MDIPIITLNGGEATPKLDCRIDIEKHQSLCRKMENFLPLLHGGAERRPGTKFIYDSVEPSAG